jgi:hypothetical protein
MEQGNAQEFGHPVTPREAEKYDSLLMVNEAAWQKLFKINELKRGVRTMKAVPLPRNCIGIEDTPWVEFTVLVEPCGQVMVNHD